MDRDGVEGAGEGGDGLVEEDWEFRDRHVGFEGVQAIVEAETTDCADVFAVQWRQEFLDVEDFVCHAVVAEDWAINELSFCRFADIRNA